MGRRRKKKQFQNICNQFFSSQPSLLLLPMGSCHGQSFVLFHKINRTGTPMIWEPSTNLGPHPSGAKACNYLPPGPVFTQPLAPGTAKIDYNLMNAHQGGCIVYMSRDNQKTWKVIGQDKKCGVYAEAKSKQGSITVKIPAGEYKAVIRWSYVAKNGGQPQEEAFGSCADVIVSAVKGNNNHNKYLLLSQEEKSQLPLDSANYWDQSCKVGSKQCGANKNFIAQCISLAASGGWKGGSGYYQYQCPIGTSCKTTGTTAACS
ncbi:hypothetical protein BDR26DRAFT_501206 [Obelidium mucronatum]|nr:hypothetical protein BDR26DRAFT_501206 [Obelidium mucronatum]